jgi:hypothetical protein
VSGKCSCERNGQSDYESSLFLKNDFAALKQERTFEENKMETFKANLKEEFE